MNNIARFLIWILIIAVVIIGLIAWLSMRGGIRPTGTGVRSPLRDGRVDEWIRNSGEHAEWAIQAGQRCEKAPFQMPTTGFVGYLWDDSFQPGHRHQGIDIFGGGQPGDTPIYAAADGYLTRLQAWKSSVIIRLPEDPLQSGRQIWTYYTHMADLNGNSLIAADFPAGTKEVFVKAGTLLGHMGNFSGTPGAPVGVHLHFSIVLDDGQGHFRNELDINNTIDPSPYFGLNLNAHNNIDQIPVCPTAAPGDQP